MNSILRIVALLAIALLVSGCEDSSREKEARAQEQMALQSLQAVGMPAIPKYTEKRTLKSILELRDKEVVTYTYITDMSGGLHLICQSVGFGIPYATQYTNPEMYVSNTGATLPQADPTGLYSPTSADGTWVMCLNPETKQAAAILIEPRIIVSPFKLH